MCTFKKVIKNLDVKVDKQKGALRFREIKLTIKVSFNSLLSSGNNPQ